MPHPIHISASILAADFANLGQAVVEAEEAGVSSIHIDFMDGRYVHNFTFGLDLLPALRRHTSLPLMVHAEIANPDAFIADFARMGADGLIVCEDTCPEVATTIRAIASAGLQVGVSLNPEQPLSILDGLLESIDHLVLLAVPPGFGGQPFTRTVMGKIQEARSVLAQLAKPPTLGVDGGVNQGTIAEIVQAGADTLIIGSGLFQGDGVGSNLRRIEGLLASH